MKGRLLTTAVSNCEDFVGRAEYVRALQREMGGEFINVGRCSGSELSAEQQAEIQSKKRGGFDRFVARGYFYLALENANREGYITEKLGRALVAGVVPVVFDARLPSGGRGGPTTPLCSLPGRTSTSPTLRRPQRSRRTFARLRPTRRPTRPTCGRTTSTPARCARPPAAPPPAPSRDARTPPSHYHSRPSRRSCMRAGRSTSQAPRRTRRSAPSAAWQRRRSKRPEPRSGAARAHRGSRRTARACRRASCVATCRAAPARPPRSRRGP